MKFKLTKKASIICKEINDKAEEMDDMEKYFDYNKCTKLEKLAIDAQLYVEGAYVKNEFKNFENWCKRTADGELQSGDRLEVKAKIGKMLIEDLITII